MKKITMTQLSTNRGLKFSDEIVGLLLYGSPKFDTAPQKNGIIVLVIF